MKSFFPVPSLLLLALLAGLAARRGHCAPTRGQPVGGRRLPQRVVRSPAVAQQHRQVRAVR